MESDKSYRTVRGYELKEKDSLQITSSMEDYLEMIYRLSLEYTEVHVSLLSETLQVKPSSVSKMNQKLKQLNLIHIETTNGISLTKEGLLKGEYLYNRHLIIEKFLTLLGNDDPLRETELLEHTISPQTLKHIEKLMAFFSNHPKIYEHYKAYLK